MKKQINISYDHYTIKELSVDDQELVEKSRIACKNAYAPYSKFLVGAALRLEKGDIILGNNQENMAYPSGLCAERVAIFAASANYPEEIISTIAVYATSQEFDFDKIVTPCGACRQVLSEYEIMQKKPIKIILASKDEAIIIHKSVDLLPFIFDASGLKE